MKHVLLVVLSVVLLLVLSSCALIFKGSDQDIPFSSQPSGAEVIIDGVSFGQTPVTINLSVNKQHTVVFRKDGEERTVLIQNEIGTLWIILDVVGGLVPLVVDAATGAWFELTPSQVSVTFN